MILHWMLYAVLLALWVTLVGLLFDRVIRSLGRGTRFVWLLVLLFSALAPLTAAWLAMQAPHVEAGSTSSALTPMSWLLIVDRVFLLGWLLQSSALLLFLALSQWSLLRARRSWLCRDVHGTTVLLSRDFGPGVVAFPSNQIVLPSWTLQLDERLQLLLFEHEREHLRAGDPWLLHAGLILLVLCPFNPILWWQFTHLKLAIEMDCDARVLAGRRNVREYAALLLDVSEKTRAARFMFAAFAAPPHAIERRIRMMLHRKSKPRRVTLALSAAGAFVIAVLACETPEPQSPEAALRAAVGLQDEGAKPRRDEPGEVCCHPSEGKGKYFVEYEAQSPDVVELDVIVEAARLPTKQGYRTTVGVDGKRLYSEARLRTAVSESKQLPPPPPPPPPPKS
jgi:bla regulator protein blaR1